VRADILHFVYLQPLFAVVLAWIVDGQDIPGRLYRSLRPLVKIYIAAAFVALGFAPLFTVITAHNRLSTRRGIVVTPRPDTVIDYVQDHVPEGGSMLVYPYLPLYYYLTDTHSPTSLEYFQYGMNTPEQAQVILSALQAKPVPVLFEATFASKVPNSWPQTPLSSVLNDPVSVYLAQHYHVCQPLLSPGGAHFLFMVQKELPCR